MAPVPLPRGWTMHVKSALLHAISLATMAVTLARGRRTRHGMHSKLERAINDRVTYPTTAPKNSLNMSKRL